MSFVRFLIARANSSQPLSKFWRTTMQKMANGQAPAGNSRLILQGCQFQQVYFKLGFYSKSKKTELKFYSAFA
jgi:hypothetical protein